jgi:hypothetical protein
MFDLQQKSIGTRYTTTVTLLVMGLFFSPALHIVSGASGYWTMSVTLAASALCVGLAWLNWKRFAETQLPSIAIQPKR